ncbi:MAG TPA: GNAT family N-acetyltransferase [Roseiflexaceae bacterium]|nr:GNAT family N-acetyltransferase [Roseiflexaceae bacterium]
MTTIDIRPCTHDDIDALLALESEWEREGIAHIFVPISRDEFAASLTQFPEYFLVAEHNGRIIGYVNGSVQLGTTETIIPAQTPYLMLENLYVNIAFRHKRVGGQLVEQFFEVAAQRGIQRFMVSSNSKQIDKILAFYQNHGFKLWHVELYK